jgi:hypothetical protein
MDTVTPVRDHDGARLLYCLGIRENGHAGSAPPELEMADWRDILRQAGENGLTPLLYHRLKTVVPAPPVPAAVLEHLRERAVHSAAHSLQIGRELREILQALRHRGIDVIVLKGGYLGQVVYGSFALRTMCDLDIMVRADALTRAVDALAGVGYAPQYYGVEDVDYAQHHHLRPMARPGGTRIEIHWSIAVPAAPFDIDLDGLWKRARRTEMSGVEALVLCPEDLVLHLCLHASYTHQFRLGVRACWDLLEVVRYHGDGIDWDQVVRRAQEWKIGRYVYLTLRLVRELLAADIPATAIAALEPPDFPAEIVTWAKTCLFSAEDASLSPSMARLWTSRRFKAKVSVLRHTLYPSRAAMARIYRTRPDSTWLYLCYAVRWADLLLRYGRHAWGLWRGYDRTRNTLRTVSERLALTEWLLSEQPDVSAARATRMGR